MKKSLITTVVLFSCLLLVTSATLADVTRITTRGKSVRAQYFQYTEGFCNGLSVEVFAGEEIIRVDHDPIYIPQLFVQVSEFNTCTEQFSFMSGGTDQFDFYARNNLSQAQVSGSVLVSNGLGDSKLIAVELAWEGGVLSTQQSKLSFSIGASHTILRGKATLRSSDSVTGSLVVDGVDLLSPSNITDVSGIFGFVVATTGASLDIIRLR